MFGFNSTDISDSSQVVEKFIETNEDFFFFGYSIILRFVIRHEHEQTMRSNLVIN